MAKPIPVPNANGFASQWNIGFKVTAHNIWAAKFVIKVDLNGQRLNYRHKVYVWFHIDVST